jgi:ubiquinone/menaquinone biosynthesis C-methylase UbiE
MLSRDEARAFYDRFGHKQDWQSIYEGRALRELIIGGAFERARSVLEIGCGTGSFAAGLLEHRLPPTATYLGTEISSTMLALARERIAPYADRATVRLTDGEPRLRYPDGAFDRFVANYVLDLLPAEEIVILLAEARRLLTPDGRLCLISLTHGTGPFSRLVVWLWKRAHGISPRFVGGCRPIDLRSFLPERTWRVLEHEIVVALGLPSQVVVAAKRG